MNLSSISTAAALYSTTALSTRVSEALGRPQEKLARAVESTRVQLSALGQVKSTTAQLETAAQGLRDRQQLSSVDGLSKAVQGFASAVNGRNIAVDRAKGNDSASSSASVAGVGDAGARAIGLETRRSLDGVAGSNRAALKEIGISVATNGGVSVDTQALQNAFAANPDKVRETLDKVGQAVAQQSARQLSSGGSVAASISRVTEQLGNAEQRQSDNQLRVEQLQRSMQDQDKRLAQTQLVVQQAFIFTGAAAYNRIFAS